MIIVSQIDVDQLKRDEYSRGRRDAISHVNTGGAHVAAAFLRWMRQHYREATDDMLIDTRDWEDSEEVRKLERLAQLVYMEHGS